MWEGMRGPRREVGKCFFFFFFNYLIYLFIIIIILTIFIIIFISLFLFIYGLLHVKFHARSVAYILVEVKNLVWIPSNLAYCMI